MEQHVTIYMRSGNILQIRSVDRQNITKFVVAWENWNSSNKTRALISNPSQGSRICHIIDISQVEAISY